MDQEILAQIANFKRPVSRDEIDGQQSVIDTLVLSGKLKTQNFESGGDKSSLVTIYWIPPNNPEQREQELQSEIAQLKERASSLTVQLDPYSSVMKAMSPKKDTINKLHDYNDIKDAAQILLGKLAEIDGIMTVELYEKYGLSKDD